MEGLTAIIPLIPSMIKAGKSVWNELVKPLLTGNGYKINKELEAEMLEKERNKDIEAFIDKLKEIQQDVNQTAIKQTYNGDGGNQVGINTGTIINYNLTDKTSEKKLSETACRLIIEIANDPSGQLTAVRLLGSYMLQIGGRDLCPDGNDRRTIAGIEAAIDELECYGLIRAMGPQRDLFEITDNGYNVADKIKL